MPEPNELQSARIALLRKQFGKDTVTPHATDGKTGNMRVELTCLAGVWQWYFDINGTYIEGHLTAKLFEMDPYVAPPTSAIDN